MSKKKVIILDTTVKNSSTASFQLISKFADALVEKNYSVDVFVNKKCSKLTIDGLNTEPVPYFVDSVFNLKLDKDQQSSNAGYVKATLGNFILRGVHRLELCLSPFLIFGHYTRRINGLIGRISGKILFLPIKLIIEFFETVRPILSREELLDTVHANGLSGFSHLFLQILEKHQLKNDDHIIITTSTIGLLNEIIEAAAFAPREFPNLHLIFPVHPRVGIDWYKLLSPGYLHGRLQRSGLEEKLFYYLMTGSENAVDYLYQCTVSTNITAIETDRIEAILANMEHIKDSPSLPKNVVLYICPPWYKSGGESVFKSQLNYLTNRGHAVVEVLPIYNSISAKAFVRNTDGISHYLTSFYRTNYPATTEQIQVFIAPNFNFKKLFKILSKLPTYISSMASQHAEYYNFSSIPDILIKRLEKNGRIDFVFVNHFFHMPLIKGKFSQSPVLLSTHDVQARNYFESPRKNRFKRERDSYEALLADEVKYTAKADVIITVSELEKDIFSEHIKDKPIHAIVSPIDRVSLLLNRDQYKKNIDVIILMANNHANVPNLAWFLDKVWVPYIGDKYQLKIIGSVIDEYRDRLNDYGETVEFLGLVNSVAEYYHRARVVALPVIMGSGIAIKTMEACVTESAFSATPLAFRGIPKRYLEQVPFVESPQEMANDLIELLSNPQLHQQRVDTARYLASSIYSTEKYQQKMDECMALIDQIQEQKSSL